MVIMQSAAMDTGGETQTPATATNTTVTAVAVTDQPTDKNQQATERCNICQTELMTRYGLQKHLAGAKHRKTLKNIEDSRKLAAMEEFVEVNLESSKGYQCKLCSIFLTSADIAYSHSQGSKHMFKKQNCASSLPVSNVVTVPIVPGSAFVKNGFQKPAEHGSSSGNVFNSSISAIPSVVNQSVATAGSGDGGGTALFHCSVCSSSVNSYTQLLAHIRGGRHKNNLQSLVDEGKAPADSVSIIENAATSGLGTALPYGITQTASGGGTFVCRQCNVVTNSSVQLQQHMLSLRHTTGGRGGTATAARGGRGRKPYQRYCPSGRGTMSMAGSAWSGLYDNSSGMTATVGAGYGGASLLARGGSGSNSVAGGGHSSPAGPAAGGGMVSPYATAGGYGQSAGVGAAGHYNAAAAAAAAAAVASNAGYSTAASHDFSTQQYLTGADVYTRNYYVAKPPPPPLQKSFVKGSHFV